MLSSLLKGIHGGYGHGLVSQIPMKELSTEEPSADHRTTVWKEGRRKPFPTAIEDHSLNDFLNLLCPRSDLFRPFRLSLRSNVGNR
jgi:hypothetical protein